MHACKKKTTKNKPCKPCTHAGRHTEAAPAAGSCQGNNGAGDKAGEVTPAARAPAQQTAASPSIQMHVFVLAMPKSLLTIWKNKALGKNIARKRKAVTAAMGSVLDQATKRGGRIKEVALVAMSS